MRLLRDYFPMKLIKTVDLDPDGNYVFGAHPHGVISFSWFGNFGSEATEVSKMFPGVKFHLMTLTMNFFTPLMRAYSLWMGKCKKIRHLVILQETPCPTDLQGKRSMSCHCQILPFVQIIKILDLSH